jgi:hypothetical protein
MPSEQTSFACGDLGSASVVARPLLRWGRATCPPTTTQREPTMSTPETICPDCPAEQRVTECTIGGRPGGHLAVTVHASSCPSFRGVI